MEGKGWGIRKKGREREGKGRGKERKRLGRIQKGGEKAGKGEGKVGGMPGKGWKQEKGTDWAGEWRERMENKCREKRAWKGGEKERKRLGRG